MTPPEDPLSPEAPGAKRAGQPDAVARLEVPGAPALLDHPGFERLFRAHYASLCGFVQRQVGSSAVAEELVQDVFLKLWSERDSIAVHTSLRAYLYAAARNRALNHLKRSDLESRWSAAESLASHGDATGPEAPRSVESEEIRARVRAAIGELSPRLRETVELRWGLQWSHAEIAEAMGVTVKAVEANVARARAALRGLLEPWIE